MKRIILIFFFFLTIISCRKDRFIAGSCNELPVAPVQGWQMQYENINWYTPCFNPENGEEFSFIKWDNKNGTSELRKYNMATKENDIIFKGIIYAQPRWGKNNWILFTRNDNNVWKIKSNGDSLIQLTTESNNFNCNWNKNNDSINFYNSILQRTILLTNSSLDTLFCPSISIPVWSSFGTLVSNSYWGIVEYNFVTDSSTVIEANYDLGSYSGACFVSDENIIWSDYKSIKQTNIKTKITNTIKSNCNSITYIYPSFSPQLNKIIWQLYVRRKINRYTLSEASILVMMNPDGSDEEEIDLK